jgi:hypothetical protein
MTKGEETMKAKVWIPTLLLCALVLPLSAQAPASIPAQREAMKKLDFLVGRWKGEGWVEKSSGQRVTFTQTENVQSKLDGTALLVEGRGTGKAPGQAAEAALFEAMAVISYDEQGKLYRFVSNTSEGRQGEFDLKPVEGGCEWGFRIPQGGRVRYTIKLNDNGQWHEIGEFSQDDKTWRKFHEMTLDRVR